MNLTDEEKAELAALEKDEKDRIAEDASAQQRQRLEALRLSKKLSSKNGKPGVDFTILETKVGNVAVRRPTDIEIDTFAETESSRGELEKFAAAVTLDPTGIDLLKLFAENPGLAPAITEEVMRLARVTREERQKK